MSDNPGEQANTASDEPQDELPTEEQEQQTEQSEGDEQNATLAEAEQTEAGDAEEQQATEQWLRQIPDEPGRPVAA